MDRSSALPRTALTTAADALRDEEIERTRGFIRIGWAIAVGAILAALALPGSPAIGRVLVIAIAATAGLSALVHHRLIKPSALRSPWMTLLALACAGCGVLAMLYTGSFGGAPLIKLREKNLNDSHWTRLTTASAVLAEIPITIDDGSGVTIAEITSRATRLHRAAPLSCVVLDYVQLMCTKVENRVNEIGAIVAWMLFAALLQSFIGSSFRGKRTIYISGFAFVAIIVAILGIARG